MCKYLLCPCHIPRHFLRSQLQLPLLKVNHFLKVLLPFHTLPHSVKGYSLYIALYSCTITYFSLPTTKGGNLANV